MEGFQEPLDTEVQRIKSAKQKQKQKQKRGRKTEETFLETRSVIVVDRGDTHSGGTRKLVCLPAGIKKDLTHKDTPDTDAGIFRGRQEQESEEEEALAAARRGRHDVEGAPGADGEAEPAAGGARQRAACGAGLGGEAHPRRAAARRRVRLGARARRRQRAPFWMLGARRHRLAPALRAA